MPQVLVNDIGLGKVEFQLLKMASEDYDSAGSDFTATSLGRTPMQYHLDRAHPNIEVPISKRMAIIIGSLGHIGLAHYAEKLTGHKVIEKRYLGTFEVDGKSYTVSAQIDLLAKTQLIDHKFLSAFSAKKMVNNESDYEFQMQLGIYLARKNGELVDSASNFVLVKDHKGFEVFDAAFSMEYKPWPDEHLEMEVETRIRDVLKLRPCTDDERWARNAHWKVIAPGKSKGRNYDTESEAKVAQAKAKGPRPEITYSPPEFARCEKFCDFSQVCIQHQKSKG